MNDVVLACHNIVKTYKQGPDQLTVLDHLNFEVRSGQRVAVIGASGSGKSTLLNILGGLDRPNEGSVEVMGKPFSTLSENARGLVRNRSLGFVYQFHHLLGEFTAVENVAMPLFIAGESKSVAKDKARALLAQVGLEKRVTHKPSELSGGERQRVAIARALANQPACVLMDEPTGNLDGDNALAIQNLMQGLSDALNTAFVVVTHDRQLAAKMDEVQELDHGQLKSVALQP